MAYLTEFVEHFIEDRVGTFLRTKESRAHQ